LPSDATRIGPLALVVGRVEVIEPLVRLCYKLLRMKTIWVDSIANADELSMSGQKAGGCADLWLTQWHHLAAEGGPSYLGSVL